ncbi:MAG: YjbE family putative metal transport protein [Sphingomonadales bacterium]|jgi:YjbE family integral membrane protein
MDFAQYVTPEALSAFGQVVMIDVVMAGDNAIVVGALAAGLPPADRKKVILIGIIAALVLRIGFALAVTQLLQIVGLVLAGGLLLLWVAWRMWRELRPNAVAIDAPGDNDDFIAGNAPTPAKGFAAAAWSVAVADVSMSLDNVLGVAAAAKDHPDIMVAGLVLSVALMGVAANVIAQVIERYRWIAYVGIAVVVYVALQMIWEGWHKVAPLMM